MTSSVNLKQQIMSSLANLPPEWLHEVVNFLGYMRFKFQNMSPLSIIYKPVALGGLLKGERIDEKDTREVRNEMWQCLEKSEINYLALYLLQTIREYGKIILQRKNKKTAYRKPRFLQYRLNQYVVGCLRAIDE